VSALGSYSGIASEAEKSVKARVLTYYEIEERFKEILTELDLRPLGEESVVEKGGELLFLFGVCISQMKAPNSTSYPEKSNHLSWQSEYVLLFGDRPKRTFNISSFDLTSGVSTKLVESGRFPDTGQ
jgi:hypothetical protein